MSETVLSLSLLNERLSATAVHRGIVAGTWERPEPVTDLADFASVLGEAVKQTGYVGTAVSAVLAHQRLAQQLVGQDRAHRCPDVAGLLDCLPQHGRKVSQVRHRLGPFPSARDNAA